TVRRGGCLSIDNGWYAEKSAMLGRSPPRNSRPSARRPSLAPGLASVVRTTVAWRMTTRDRRLKRKIERARRVLGTKTNRETIERALDTVLAEEQVRRALRRAGASGGSEAGSVYRR